MKITEEDVRLFEEIDAPKEFLVWSRESPRTYESIIAANDEWELWLAENSASPESAFAVLRNSPDWKVRMLVALNAGSPQVLESLRGDPEPNVRAALAENANTPISILRMLCHDEEDSVRETAQSFYAGSDSSKRRSHHSKQFDWRLLPDNLQSNHHSEWLTSRGSLEPAVRTPANA